MAPVRADDFGAGLPLPSPTLTNPDMILPYGDQTNHEPSSPIWPSERPPSPSQLLENANLQVQVVQLADAPPGRKGLSARRLPAAALRTTSTTLPDIEEVETTPTKQEHFPHSGNSSPIPNGSSAQNLRGHDRPGTGDHTVGRASDESSSLDSDEIEEGVWSAFEQSQIAQNGVNMDRGVSRLNPLPKVAGEDEDLESLRFQDEQNEEGEEPFSHSALSRRAEIILENAKKRLNLMEDNLRGARHSLLLSPGPQSSSRRVSSEFDALTGVRDRKSYSALGLSGSKQKTLYRSASTAGNQGHSRVFSDGTISSPLESSAQMGVNGIERRAASALGDFGRHRSVLDAETLAHAQAIRGSRSQEAMRDIRLSSWGLMHDHPLPDASSEAKAGPTNLEPLPEDDAPCESVSSSRHRNQGAQSRPQSTTIDIRAQMKELKGRISSLQQRAREDGMRRRSHQSLRSSTPLTAAETWYAGADGYKLGSYSTDAGVGWSPASPAVGKGDHDENAEQDPTQSWEQIGWSGHSRKGSGDQMTDYEQSQYQDAEEGRAEEADDTHDGVEEDEEEVEDAQDGVEEENEEELYEGQESHLEEDGLVAENETIYEEAEDYLPPVAERHEDRVDAFDYEHFFLHSAMGSYSRSDRRSSFGSTDSVETTKPLTEQKTLVSQEMPVNPRGALHLRQKSVDSISTLATFATATEGNDEGEDQDKGDYLDRGSSSHATGGTYENFEQQAADGDWPITAFSPGLQLSPPLSTRPDSAVDVHDDGPTRASSVTSPAAYPSPTSSHGSRANRKSRPRPISAMVSTLLYASQNGPNASENGPKMRLRGEDKALVYGLAESLRNVCEKLQNSVAAGKDDGNAEMWRRRLDEARKVLDGDWFGGLN